MNVGLLLLLVPVLLLAAPSVAATGGHYTPQVGDQFGYTETWYLGSGTGDYSSYYENEFINGSVTLNAVAANGTESASYANSDSWSNSSGSAYHWTASGTFTFSATTFLYVQGTDNQTGYTNPYVWFYMDNGLPTGGSFTLLNTPMSVVSTDHSYALASSATGYVKTIFAEGNGSFERNDVYGSFGASYNWKSYFDPSTGYIVGYLYTEQDSNGSGDGFTITDLLQVRSTTYPLTSSAAPATGSSGISETLVIALVAVVVLVVIVLVIALALRSRRTAKLPQHSAGGNVGFGPPPLAPQMAGLPPVRLTPSGQPGVQQIVIRETVKVNCRYCGTLMDSTATNCPNCGAPRT